MPLPWGSLSSQVAARSYLLPVASSQLEEKLREAGRLLSPNPRFPSLPALPASGPFISLVPGQLPSTASTHTKPAKPKPSDAQYALCARFVCSAGGEILPHHCFFPVADQPNRLCSGVCRDRDPGHERSFLIVLS